MSNGKREAGRPTVYSEVVAAKLCNGLMEGKSLRTVCKRDGMPSETTVYRWLHDDEHPNFRDKYMRAREVQGTVDADRILEIVDKLEDEASETDHNRSRVAIDGLKWLAERKAPKVWGARVQADVKHDATGGLAAAAGGLMGIDPATLDTIRKRAEGKGSDE